MILPESQPFVWDEAEWRRHIESVLLAIGRYENDKHIVRETTLPNLPWAVDHRDGDRWSSELYDNMSDAINDFMSLETLPPLGQPESAEQSQLTSEDTPSQSQLTLFDAASRVNPSENRTVSKEKKMGYYAEYKVVRGRQVYHVVPAEKGWEVKKEGNKRPSVKTRLKKDAIDRAKELAKKAKLGQVIIHKKDGTIQTEYTYGEDPRRTKG